MLFAIIWCLSGEGVPFFDARQRMAKKTSIGSALCTPTVTLAELSQGSSEIMLGLNLTSDAHKSARRTVCKKTRNDICKKQNISLAQSLESFGF